jgi:hypothetical protein
MLNVMTSTGVEITRLIGDLHLLMVISSGWGYTYPSEKSARTEGAGAWSSGWHS